MKSFKEFLKEEDIEASVKMLLDKCSDYFKYTNKNPSSDVFYRGVKGNHQPDSFKMQTRRLSREGRVPSDTSDLVHKIANQIFQKQFKYPFRDGMMVTASESQAAEYGWKSGPPIIIIPANGYTLCYSPIVNDFYGYIAMDIAAPEHNEKAVYDEVEEAIREGQYAAGVDLTGVALHTMNEVMLYPEGGSEIDYFTFTPKFWFEQVVPLLKKEK